MFIQYLQDIGGIEKQNEAGLDIRGDTDGIFRYVTLWCNIFLPLVDRHH